MLQIEGRSSAFLLAAISIVLLSTNASAAIFLGGTATYFAYSILTSLIAFAVLFLLIGAKGLRNTRKVLKSRWFLAAVAAKAINDLAFYYAVMGSQEIEATIIVYLYPLFNLLLGTLILSDKYARLTGREWVLVALGFVSIILLTPLSDLASLTSLQFGAAILSAVASVYVVLLQKTADDSELKAKDEKCLFAWMYLGSVLIHVMIVAAVLIYEPAAAFDLLELGSQPMRALAGALWIGVVVYILSEALWLRASRTYNAVSLKSMFYLSPVLGALYLHFLGIDAIDSAVVFCLTGVVMSNFLIHQKHIDDVPFIAFLAGIISSAVILELLPSNRVTESFALSPDLFQTQITFVSVIGGFVLFRALEVYQRTADSFQSFVDALLKGPNLTPDELEAGLDRMIRDADCALWDNKTVEESKFAAELRSSPEAASAYIKFFSLRLGGLSRSERILMYLVCLLAVPSIWAQAISAQSGFFVAAFSSGLFCFLPVLVDEQSSFRIARPIVGVLLRRGLWSANRDHETEAAKPRKRFLRNERFRGYAALVLTVATCLPVWFLLELQ